MTEERLDRIEGQLKRLEGDVHTIEGRLETLESNLQNIEKKLGDVINQIRELSLSIDTYQKADQQVVNLAFGLIVATTATIVIPAVFGK
ncbi:hypothetical protein H0901_11725 [Microcystis aeruginosa BLCCF158]|uniref:Uncharacterized protein n=1 Tax=Microcystis aeruginosa BLCC-F158 TaxID=2755316 RepID=A0A841UZH7_MICAE|nr:hypothetical protein [Microcystis aeruginosa]MBC1195912.1 hypothetical protein [Microcystis aeruginosa BLCC-F158]